MRQFEWIKRRQKAEKVTRERVMHEYAAQQALIKIIWSGFGDTKPDGSWSADNRPSTCGQWDMTHWDYLIRRLVDPAHNRTVYATFRYQSTGDVRHDRLYTKMGDTVDRRFRYDPRERRYVERSLLNQYGDIKVRGRDRSGIKTIKKTHVSLLPKDGQMLYCRGIDPSTGVLARAGARHYNAARQAFPGCQIALMFSADARFHGKVPLCSEKDLMGRRYPWLQNERSALYRLRKPGTNVSATVLPDMITFAELQRRLNTTAPPRHPRTHNDVMFKASKESVSGILLPGMIEPHSAPYSEGYMGVINAVQKKCYLLETLNKDVPIFRKSPVDAALTEISLQEQWRYLYAGSYIAELRDLVLAIELRALDLSPAAFQQMLGHARSICATAAEAEASVVRFVASSMGMGDVSRLSGRLNTPECLASLVRTDRGRLRCDNVDAFYALLQCGAPLTSPRAINFVLQQGARFNSLLTSEQKQQLVQSIDINALVAEATQRSNTISEGLVRAELVSDLVRLLDKRLAIAALGAETLREPSLLRMFLPVRRSIDMFRFLLRHGASVQDPQVQKYLLNNWQQLRNDIKPEQKKVILDNAENSALILRYWLDIRADLRSLQRQKLFVKPASQHTIVHQWSVYRRDLTELEKRVVMSSEPSGRYVLGNWSRFKDDLSAEHKQILLAKPALQDVVLQHWTALHADISDETKQALLLSEANRQTMLHHWQRFRDDLTADQVQAVLSSEQDDTYLLNHWADFRGSIPAAYQDGLLLKPCNRALLKEQWERRRSYFTPQQRQLFMGTLLASRDDTLENFVFIMRVWSTWRSDLTSQQRETVVAALLDPAHIRQLDPSMIMLHWPKLRTECGLTQKQAVLDYMWQSFVANDMLTEQTSSRGLIFLTEHRGDFLLSPYQRKAVASYRAESYSSCNVHLYNGGVIGSEFELDDDSKHVLFRKLFFKLMLRQGPPYKAHANDIILYMAELLPEHDELEAQTKAERILLLRCLMSAEFHGLSDTDKMSFVQGFFRFNRDVFLQARGSVDANERTIVDDCLRLLADELLVKQLARMGPALLPALINRQLLAMDDLQDAEFERRAMLMLRYMPYRNGVDLMGRLLSQPRLTFAMLEHDRALLKRVAGFVVGHDFSNLPLAQQGILLNKFSNMPWHDESPLAFSRFTGQLNRVNPEQFKQYLESDRPFKPAQLSVLAKAIQLPQIALFAVLLQRHVACIESLSRLRSKRAALPALRLMNEALQALQLNDHEGTGYIVSPEHEEKMQHAIEACVSQQAKMSPDLWHVLVALQKVYDKRLHLNPVLNLSVTGEPVVARLPQMAFDVSRQTGADNEALSNWRKQAHDHFRGAAQTDAATVAAFQNSVEVYSCINSNNKAGVNALVKSLDRKSGYAMTAFERPYTKQRVICSDALLYNAADDIQAIGLATLVAPNLRRSQHGSMIEVNRYIDVTGLNEQKYYEAVYNACRLAFHGLQQRAKRVGKKSIVISPLLGMGAYLYGQKDAIKRQAIKVSVNAMMAAFSAAAGDELAELHLCAPLSAIGANFEPYDYIKQLQREGKLSQVSRPFVVSQSNAFELAALTQDVLDGDEHDVALLNPGSDHVPGGGCYDDHKRAVASNTPGCFTARARALEEQLAHVTNFMYSQCASMNAEHLTMDRLHAVSISAAGEVHAQSHSYAEQLGVDAHTPVQQVLSERFKAIYDPAAYRAEQRVRAERLREKQAQAHAKKHPGSSASMSSASAGAGAGAGAAAALPRLTARATLKQQARKPRFSSSEYHTELKRFVAEISRHQSCLMKAFRGDKFADIALQLSTQRGFSASEATHWLAEILAVAVTHRGCGDLTDSGRYAMNALFGYSGGLFSFTVIRYPALYDLFKQAARRNNRVTKDYAGIVKFCVSQLPAKYSEKSRFKLERFKRKAVKTTRAHRPASTLHAPLLVAGKPAGLPKAEAGSRAKGLDAFDFEFKM